MTCALCRFYDICEGASIALIQECSELAPYQTKGGNYETR